MKRFALAAALGFLCLTAAAQQFDLSIDSIMRGTALVGWEPDDLRWSPDGSKIYFGWKQYTEPMEKDRDTYVANRDGSGLRKLSDEEKKDAPPGNAQWTRDRMRAAFADDGDIFVWENGHRRALTQTKDTESGPQWTFDEKRITFIRANNVYALDLGSGLVQQLTNIAGPEDKNPLWNPEKGTESQEVLKKEERKLLDVIERRARKREEDEAKRKKEHPLKPFKLERKQTVTQARLTPDGKYVVAVISNESDKVKKAIVPAYVTESAYTETIPSREKVGDVQPPTRIAILDTANGEQKWFEHGLKAPQTKQESEQKTEKSEGVDRNEKTDKPKDREVALRMPIWSDDGKHAFVIIRSADNKDLWLMAFDPSTARGHAIASTHDDDWIRFDPFTAYGWLADNQTIYFPSEQSGYMHLYEVSYDGGAPKAMTSGKWEVDSVVLSKDKKSFYLTTSEESPYERHLYRMPVTGGARVKLTSGPGDHEGAVSPDGTTVAEVFSYTNKPPEVYVGGKRVTNSPAPEFSSYAWLDVPIVQIPARDGAQVPARFYKPAQPNGRAVIFVHGAGYLQNVHRFWSSYYREYMFHHLLMSRGYTVLDADYRGSRGYGRDWRTAIYRHMGGQDLDDQVDAAKWLVKEQGIDPKKIGIYGGSYGGFITLMALFTTPDVFAAGAALRPVTDWAHYNQGYTSNILNLPQSDTEAYHKSSPIYFAEGLKGRLLICHGMVDTNVHFQDSVRLVQRLIELRKTNWELAVFPVENHGFVEPTSWADEYKRIYKLFDEALR
jgi:dipeptidyl aminopeptidase/acylaminoacyl peptidase